MIWRIRDRATFRALRRGRTGRCPPVRVRFVPEPSAPAARVAYAVSTAIGTAVERNRVRRRLRAAVACLDRSTPGGLARGAYLLTAEPAARTTPYATLCAAVEAAVERAQRPEPDRARR
ncbi:MAG: ribonuclease P protein component [Acidimicrobiales bacterium]